MTRAGVAASHPERILVQVGRFSLHHLYRHDAQRPDVHFRAVRLSGHHLRRHPVGRPHHGAALVLLGGDLGAEAKVGCRRREKRQKEEEVRLCTSGDLLSTMKVRGRTELDGSVHSQEDVVTFDVSVDHLVGVQEVEGLETLEEAGKKKILTPSVSSYLISFLNPFFWIVFLPSFSAL